MAAVQRLRAAVGRTDPGQARFPVGRALPVRQEQQAVLQVQAPPAASRSVLCRGIRRRALPDSPEPSWKPLRSWAASRTRTPDSRAWVPLYPAMWMAGYRMQRFNSTATLEKHLSNQGLAVGPLISQPPADPAWQEWAFFHRQGVLQAVRLGYAPAWQGLDGLRRMRFVASPVRQKRRQPALSA